ncbi:MFS transporter [Halalkalibacter nanhaiisediminis]|uniref:MFS-type drug efflux transporter P55 n=1 Tax=Halalkalibacter nanhaiisediminis TaxID=688079 RepID=A0A562QNZ7_9BACI|nr:MFS transporter [Halalkalibacter nanhaiisediminis]TWI57786.1 ACDE family multidrug resistance protein [Halalkalibacter nanhaiisediminis]
MKQGARLPYLLFFIGLLPFIMVIGNSMFIPLLPHMQAELGLTMIEGGWILTSFSIPAAVLVPFGGILSDRYGRKKVAMLALPLIMIGSFISALAGMNGVLSPVFEWMIVGRIIQGVGAGGITPLAMAFISDLYTGEKRSRALGSIEVFNGAGKVLSPIIGGIILGFSWTISFVILFATALLAFVGIFLFVDAQKQVVTEKEHIFIKYKRLQTLTKKHWKWLVPIFASGAIGMFLMFGYLFYLSHLLDLADTIPSMGKGFILACPLLVLTVFSYLTGRRLKGREDSYKRGFLLGIGLMIIGTWSMIHSMEVGFIVVGMIIYGTGFGILLPSANAALASIVSKKERGTVFAFYAMLRFLGVAFGPVLFGTWMNDPTQLLFTSLFFVMINGVILLFSWSCLPIGKSCVDSGLT